MLEIRYNKTTKELTGWCGDEKQFGEFKDRGNEAMAILDIPIPDKDLDAWLFDGDKLTPNPAYVEPEPPFNAKAEIAELRNESAKLKARLDKITR